MLKCKYQSKNHFQHNLSPKVKCPELEVISLILMQFKLFSFLYQVIVLQENACEIMFYLTTN